MSSSSRQYSIVKELLHLSCYISGRDRAEGAPQRWHVAWAGAASRGQNLEVPGALAGCLNIAPGITVTARAVSDIPEAIGVCVEPISVDDWEVVEQNAGHMEDQILSQVHAHLMDIFSRASPALQPFMRIKHVLEGAHMRLQHSQKGIHGAPV